MRTLKYAILGLLNQTSMSGYELAKQFESTLCEFWYAKHSQIYPELKKLTDEGCIVYDIQISGESLEKKIYTVTEKGHNDFMSWLSSETEIGNTPKDVARLKIFYSSRLSSKDRERFLTDQLFQHQSRLRHLQQNQKKFVEIPSSESDEFGDYLLLMGGIMREETNCEWLKECIRLSKQQ